MELLNLKIEKKKNTLRNLAFCPKIRVHYNRDFDQFVVPTHNMTAGMYIISLQVNGKIVEQVKETIFK
jgi:hypothetical protein